MSTARERILERVRRGLEGPQPRRGELRAHPRPGLDKAAGKQFMAKVRAAAGSVAVVSRWEQVGEAAALYLHGAGRPLRLTRAPDPQLDIVVWPEGMVIDPPRPRARSDVALSCAVTAVVETGSLVLVSGPDNPTLFNFLSDVHIIAVAAKRIVAHLEDVWPLLRRQGLPRAVNFITGPSRTADVEQSMQLGAHGPRRLHVIIVREG